jgi:hypothetical protein
MGLFRERLRFSAPVCQFWSVDSSYPNVKLCAKSAINHKVQPDCDMQYCLVLEYLLSAGPNPPSLLVPSSRAKYPTQLFSHLACGIA